MLGRGADQFFERRERGFQMLGEAERQTGGFASLGESISSECEATTSSRLRPPCSRSAITAHKLIEESLPTFVALKIRREGIASIGLYAETLRRDAETSAFAREMLNALDRSGLGGEES